MKNIWMTLTLVLALLLQVGCMNGKEPSPEQDTEASAIKNPRAAAKTRYGDLSLMPVGKEVIEKLDAASCSDSESDVSIQGDYELLYKDKEGNSSVVTTYRGLTLIAKDEAPIQLEVLSFPQFDAVIFTPEPHGCPVVQMYLFAVGKDQQAFQWTFENEGILGEKPTHSTLVLPDEPPVVQGGQLIVPTAINSEGGDDLFFHITYTPDLSNQLMKFVQKEAFIRE